LVVLKREPGSPYPGVKSQGMISPFCPFSNERGKPLHLWKIPSDSVAEQPKLEITAPDQTHLDVVLTRQRTPKIQRRVRLLTTASPPIVTEIYETYPLEKSKTINETRIQMSDFRKCSGGLVPARVVCCNTLPGGKIAVREWRSEDLGRRGPEKNDFLVQ